MLFLCGLPGGYPDDLIDVDLDALEGEGVIRVSNADYLARPLRLTPTEATAIIVALRALRAGSAKDTRDVVDRALAKLEAAAAGSTPLVDPGDDIPGTVVAPGPARGRGARRGARSGSPTTSPRATRSRSGSSTRTRVVSHHGVDYLDAYCHSADAPRLFRLDRIHEATVLDSRDHDGARAAARPLRRRLRRRGGDPGHARACTPRRGGSRSTTPWRRSGPRPDGGSEVDLQVGDEQLAPAPAAAPRAVRRGRLTRSLR